MRQIHPDTEITVLALADKLGISRPSFQRAHRPEPWQCWADRVMLAASRKDAGHDPSIMIAEAERYGGNETDEIRVLQVAERLGIARPMMRREEQPEVWSWWAEVVRTAETVAAAGGDIAELRRRAVSFDGSLRTWPAPDQPAADPT